MPSSAAPPAFPPPPALRSSGPAENPAAREPGGAGTSVMCAGFRPTIANVASAGVLEDPLAGASAESAGVPPPAAAGRLGGARNVLGTPFNAGAPAPTAAPGEEAISGA